MRFLGTIGFWKWQSDVGIDQKRAQIMVKCDEELDILRTKKIKN